MKPIVGNQLNDAFVDTLLQITPQLSAPETLYSVAEVKEFDRWLIDDQGISALSLVHQAGKAVVFLLEKQWLEKRWLEKQRPNPSNFIIFAGGGNNGADAYVVATLLKRKSLNVTVYTTTLHFDLAYPAKDAALEAIALGVEVRGFSGEIPKPDNQNTVIIDGLCGIGFQGVLREPLAQMIDWINQSGCDVVSLDVPSGLNAQTGHLADICVCASATVTFIALKQGLLTGKAANVVGQLFYAPLVKLQYFEEFERLVVSDVRRLTLQGMQARMPRRLPAAHKGMQGHLWILGGDRGFFGAALLAAEASLRTGIGRVTVVTHSAHLMALNARLPEAMTYSFDDIADQSEDVSARLLAGADVVLVGPGLGQGVWGQALFHVAMKWSAQENKPLVLDADALNLLSKSAVWGGVSGASMRETSGVRPWVMTPHPLEAARLLGVSVDEIEKDRFLSVRQLAQKWQSVCILKGAGTLIAAGDAKNLSVSHTGNEGMAVGGMGDILAGMISAWVGQCASIETASQLGVFFHGFVADYLKKNQGVRGMLAHDLCQYLPKCVNDLIHCKEMNIYGNL